MRKTTAVLAVLAILLTSGVARASSPTIPQARKMLLDSNQPFNRESVTECRRHRTYVACTLVLLWYGEEGAVLRVAYRMGVRWEHRRLVEWELN